MFSVDYSKVLRAALSRGGEFADIFIERSSSLSIVCEDSKIEKVVSGVDHGAGVRVISGSRAVYASTNDLSEPALLELADSVSKAVRGQAGAAGTANVIAMTRSRPPVEFVITKPPESVETAGKKSMVLKANGVAAPLDPRIRQVMVVYRESRQEVTIVTSDGTLSEDDRRYLTAFVNVVAADGSVVQTGYEPIGGFTGMELFDAVSLEQAAEKAGRRAVSMLSARKAPAGAMPVVLSSEAGGTMIHEAVGHGLEADLAQSGLSAA
jgi:TldD protein